MPLHENRITAVTDEAIRARTLVCQYTATLRSFFLFPNHSDDMNAQKIARELYNDGMYHAKADDEGTPVVLELFCRPSGGIVNWGRREDARKKREEEERLQKLKDEKMRELQSKGLLSECVLKAMDGKL